MILRTTALILALSVAGAFSQTGNAQDRLSRTELTAISNDLGLSVEELQAKNAQLQIQNADIALQLRELADDSAQLNGRIETLQFQLSQSRDEVTRMRADDQKIGKALEKYDGLIEALKLQVSDLEQRLTQREQVYAISEAQLQANAAANSDVGNARLGSGDGSQLTVPSGSQPQSTLGAGAQSTGQTAGLPSQADPLFQDGKARLLRFDYQGAERSFSAFLERFGDNPQAGEAQYWLGEVLFQQKSYSESGAAYSDMIRNFPADPRAPDALVKLGRSLRLVGDQTRACAILATLPSRYPEASPVTRQLADTERTRSACQS